MEAHPLEIYDRYDIWLDDQFDDGLIITYEVVNSTIIFKIIYDPTISLKDLMEKIPSEWKTLEAEGKIKLIIKEYSKDSEESKRAQKIIESDVMVAARAKLMDQLDAILKMSDES